MNIPKLPKIFQGLIRILKKQISFQIPLLSMQLQFCLAFAPNDEKLYENKTKSQ